MRILVAQRHYWPDVPTYAILAHHVARRLASDGHDVTVFSARPSYNAAYQGPRPPRREQTDGLSIIRMRLPKERKGSTALRILDTLLFLGGLLAHLVTRRRYDLIVVTNSPPVALAALARRAGRTRYLYLCQDIQPEIGLLSGMIKQGWIANRLLSMDRRNCERAAAVVVLSEDMRNALTDRDIDVGNVTILNNFILPWEPADPPEALPSPKGFRVLFSGNMGRFQGLDRVVAAARTLQSRPEIEFVFMGSGVEVETLREQAADLVGRTITFLPHLPLPAAMAVTETADLGLVTLRPGAYRLAYPSKTMSYLAAGCRLLLLIEPESSLAAMVASEDLGVVCASSEPGDIANAILAEERRRRDQGPDRDRQRTAGRMLFGTEAALDRWASLIASLER